jgi:hypothetical protein
MDASRSSDDGQTPGSALGPAETGEDAARGATVSAPGTGGGRRTRRHLVRQVLAAVPVVVFAILLPVTILAT